MQREIKAPECWVGGEIPQRNEGVGGVATGVGEWDFPLFSSVIFKTPSTCHPHGDREEA